jgi:hypothetical protein
VSFEIIDNCAAAPFCVSGFCNYRSLDLTELLNNAIHIVNQETDPSIGGVVAGAPSWVDFKYESTSDRSIVGWALAMRVAVKFHSHFLVERNQAIQVCRANYKQIWDRGSEHLSASNNLQIRDIKGLRLSKTTPQMIVDLVETLPSGKFSLR